MEFVSKNLLLSLKQDLKILNAVSLEIANEVKFFEVNSWLYPTKNYKEVPEIIPVSASNYHQYLLHIELMVDRLYLIINLVTKYLETHHDASGERRITPKNIVRPKNLSLGASTELMWKTLLNINNLNIRHSKSIMEPRLPKEMFNDKDTQTKMYFSNMCSSCCTATSCIKEIANELAMNIEAVALRKIRQDLQEDICDITQYGCMYRLTTAIIEDVQTIVERLEIAKVENNNYMDKVESVTLKCKRSVKVNKSLESSLKVLAKRFGKAKTKNANLSKKNKELSRVNQEKESTIQREKAKVATLQNSIEESTVSLALLSTDNERLQKDYTQTMSDSLGSLAERDMWKSRFSEVYLENRRLKSELDQLHSERQTFENSMDKISKDCQLLSQNLEKSNTNIERRSKMFESFIKNMTDVETNQIRDASSVVAFKDSHIPAFPTFEVKGDPVTDMKLQIETNLVVMKNLEHYNSDLLRTILRIEEKTVST